MSDNKASFDKHIGALDGIRAYAIIIVVWYHLWQQNWMSPYITFNNSFTKYLGITEIPLASVVRYGFNSVDILVFLSAFCNFLPYMRSIVLGEKWPNAKEFFIKRLARIAPSYYLALGVSIVISIIQGDYVGRIGFGVLDILSHLLFVSPFFKHSVLLTPLNAVVWTVEIEVLFYLVIPVIAKLFKKAPVVTYMLMLVTGMLVNNVIRYNFTSNIRSYVNWPLTFLVVYANGLLACYLLVYLKSVTDENNITIKLCFTIISLISFVLLIKLMISVGSGEDMQLNQLSIRLMSSFSCALFVISTCLAGVGYQKIFSNRITKYICFISYNLYLWHQYVFAKMVQWRIPDYVGDENPAWSGNRRWQWSYTMMAVTDVIIIAVVVTLFFEIPIKNFIIKKYKKWNKNRVTLKEKKQCLDQY